jgi:hypothetical protein
MDTIVERPATLDVHKAQVTVCVRGPSEREERVAEFATTVGGLLGLRDWLTGYRVQQVVMEATEAYWKAPWAILEDEFECLLVNARQPSPPDAGFVRGSAGRCGPRACRRACIARARRTPWGC